MGKYKLIYCVFIVFIVVFGCLMEFGDCIRWLSLQHSHIEWNLSINNNNNNPSREIRSGKRSICARARRRYGFVKSQAKLCRNEMEIMPHVQSAAILASETCRNIFKYRRWNCSSIILAPYLPPDLTRATREQAYVYAISSAALTYTMARACSSGALYHCTCATKSRNLSLTDDEEFQWGGCGDNVDWGAQFTKKFIDNVEKNTLEKWKKNLKIIVGLENNNAAAAAVNLHNNRVGRKVIIENLRIQCKCHGVSGSCNIKTCWKSLPTMFEIGIKLMEKYTNAYEISTNIIKQIISNNLDKKMKNIVNSHLLVFISKSPDYCTKDETLGSFGTVGRQCNVSSSGPESCRQLCCGRGYRTVVDEKIERCQCKFYNCCYVKCKICRTKTQIFECL